jgi:outer membrane protein
MKICNKFKILRVIILLLFISNQIYAQKQMSLRACINYALENSYAVKQKILEKESNNIKLQATKTSIAPSLGANVGQNFDFGRAQGADKVETNTTQSSTNFGVGLNMDIFNGLRTHHQMKSDQLNLEATLLDIESAKENIELMVTANYLQILLNKEMLEVLKTQVVLDQEQVDRIKVLVNNGKSSDAELYAANSTLATDQLSVVEAQNAVRLALLDLAQLMNYPDVINFNIVTEGEYSEIDILLNKTIDVTSVAENALENRPAIKAALIRIEQAKRSIKVYQSGWYPSLNLSVHFGTGYFYQFNIPYNLSFGEQFKNFAGESLGLSLQIPIFDKLSTHFNVKQQKISVKYQELQLEETKRALIKEIEQAYVNAVAAKEKYIASQAANNATNVAFEYEEIKYNAGTSTSYEFSEAKNKYMKAQSNLLQAKFDFLFRIKILEFYGRE